jgi:heptosyltransferase II
MRTLILSPRFVSEAVMTQPLVALLKRFDPRGRIDVLVGPYVAPVYDAMADVDRVISSPHAFGALQPLGKLMLTRRLSRQHDRAYVLSTDRASALLPWLIGIPVRIGPAGPALWRLLNRRSPPPGDGDSPVRRFARLALDPAHPVGARIPEPVLARDPARDRAARAKAGIERDQPLLLLCVGTDGASARRWPARHFATVAARAAVQWPGITIATLGPAADRPFATEIAALSGQPIRNLCGALTLADSIALIAQAHGVVTADTSLMHIASAYRRPTVALFGPTDPRRAAVPAARTRIEWLQLECSPCDDRICRFGHNDCMNGLAPDTVFGSLRQAMQFAVRHIR